MFGSSVFPEFSQKPLKNVSHNTAIFEILTIVIDFLDFGETICKKRLQSV